MCPAPPGRGSRRRPQHVLKPRRPPLPFEARAAALLEQHPEERDLEVAKENGEALAACLACRREDDDERNARSSALGPRQLIRPSRPRSRRPSGTASPRCLGAHHLRPPLHGPPPRSVWPIAGCTPEQLGRRCFIRLLATFAAAATSSSSRFSPSSSARPWGLVDDRCAAGS